MKFGKTLPKRSLKTLALSNYLKASAVPVPAMHAWERSIDYKMLKNDALGCCVIAGAAHLEMSWRSVANAGTPLLVTDDQVVSDYSAVAGYVPGNESTDQGTNMLDAMHYWLRHGFVGQPPAQTFATLDVQNIDQIKSAIYLFGGTPIGFNVPQSMVDQLNSGVDPTFEFKANDKPSGEGHCVLPIGFGRSGFALVSWGKIYRASWDFFQAWVDEAYCVVSKDWFKQSGVTPTGLDLDGMLADLPK